MQKILMTIGVMVLAIWIWSEYFRAIPHLAQPGVAKNFNIKMLRPHEATYTVIEQHFASPQRRMVYPTTTSTMMGGFNDLIYVSNIDVLLTSLAHVPEYVLEYDEVRRCYFLPESTAIKHQHAKAHVVHYSLIAQNEQIANQIRRLKSGHKVMLRGELVEVSYRKTGRQFLVGVGSSFAQNCHIFKVNAIHLYESS